MAKGPEVSRLFKLPIRREVLPTCLAPRMTRISGLSSHSRIFFGRIAGIRDTISFHGETVNELETAFKEAVDHYLDTCARLGDEPNKPYSGKLTLRIPPSIHAAIATAAETSGKSLNKWVVDTLDQVIHAQ